MPEAFLLKGWTSTHSLSWRLLSLFSFCRADKPEKEPGSLSSSLLFALSLSRAPVSYSCPPDSWTCCRFNINPASALTYMWGWKKRGLWIGSHSQNESLGFSSRTQSFCRTCTSPLTSAQSSSFGIHLELFGDCWFLCWWFMSSSAKTKAAQSWRGERLLLVHTQRYAALQPPTPPQPPPLGWPCSPKRPAPYIICTPPKKVGQ